MSTKATWLFRGVCVAVCVSLASVASAEILMQTVHVGDAANAADSTGYGAVAYEYNIGKYEVTAEQYTEFLNAVAKTDTHGLYNASMAIMHYSQGYGCGISRIGSDGEYSYIVDAAFVDRPVNYVSWGDAARFANWLHNGRPVGGQDLTTTEDGAYLLDGATSSAALIAVSRKAGWQWAIAGEDEWYKAAYYKGGGKDAGYWLLPTQSNSSPGRDMADLSGNNANYYGTPVPLDNPYWGTVAGEFQDSESAYETFDQGGNVWEWNEAVIGASRGLRGGSFYAGAEGPNDLYSTTRWQGDPSADNNYIPLGLYGFRVVTVPEPTTMVLLALGALTLIRKKGVRNLFRP